MKYRVQLEATFNNTNSNNILNYIESIKDKVFSTVESTEVTIIRKADKRDHVPNDVISLGTGRESVDFDNPTQETYSASPEGVTEFDIILDVSFSIQQDMYDLLNYVESIKSEAILGSNYSRMCRFFECRHEEVPLSKDGPYSYIDFDGAQVNHPVA